jgi:hypothetical protein
MLNAERGTPNARPIFTKAACFSVGIVQAMIDGMAQ